MMPPIKPHEVAAIRIHRRPNLSEMRPNKMIEMADAMDQMIEKRLALALGPVLFSSCSIWQALPVLTNVFVDGCDDGCGRRETPVSRSVSHQWCLVVQTMGFTHTVEIATEAMAPIKDRLVKYPLLTCAVSVASA